MGSILSLLIFVTPLMGLLGVALIWSSRSEHSVRSLRIQARNRRAETEAQEGFRTGVMQRPQAVRS